MGIDTYECSYTRRATESAAEFRSAAEYPALVAEAKGRGFVPAPVSLLKASVKNLGAYNDRLFTWKGGLWVRAGDELLSVYD